METNLFIKAKKCLYSQTSISCVGKVAKISVQR